MTRKSFSEVKKRVSTLLFRISPFVSEDDFCGVKLPTQSIKHDRFNRGPNNFDEDQDTMKGTISSKAKIITFQTLTEESIY